MTMATLLLATAPPAPVWISPDAAPVPAAGGSVWLPWLLAAAAVLLVLVAAAVWRFGGSLDKARAERLAFAWLARRVGVRRDARRLIESLAAAHGAASPVALLLSEAAFLEAWRRAERSAAPPPASQVLALEQRLFR